jgi:D-alanyl-D-alanine carboxypeptidase/D-alanyl-D-alanine-endopeptidase (penicillin-binding protein 4)
VPRLTGAARAGVAAAMAAALTACHHPSRSVTAASSPAGARASLQQDIDRILNAPPLQRAHWAMLARSLGRDETTVYALNEGRLMIPASSLKLVTLAVASERLGWDFRYQTYIAADGAIRAGVLEGNLVVVGSGDPSVDQAALDSWAERVRGLGVSEITGGVLADGRAFEKPGLGFGWSWDDLAYYYAAPVAAAQFRENAVDLTLTPGPMVGDPVDVVSSPSISGLEIENRLRTGPTSALSEFVARRSLETGAVVLEGTLPAASRSLVRSLAVADPVTFLAAGLHQTLLAHGIRVHGPPAAVDTTQPPPAVPLFTHVSPPLSALARHMMEVSQNQYAETLLMTLGGSEPPASFRRGLQAEEAALASWAIAGDEVVLRDGSGLSRYNYVTPQAMVATLTHVYRSPEQRDPFLAALNVAGRSGTIATRLRNSIAEGHVRAKDGSMAGVRSFCGFVMMPGAPPLAFAILVNGFAAPGQTITAAIDAIVLKLASYPGP